MHMNSNLEQLLTNKQFYQSLTEGENQLQTVTTLSSKLNGSAAGEKDDIRFAQAELYAQIEDYETAIFKWENVKKAELSGWALKNMGDIYQLMDLVDKAEASYLAVCLPAPILKMETLLSLFELYEKAGDSKKAHRVMNDLVSTNFSYKNVTDLALKFFEQINEYISATELIVNQLEKRYEEKYIKLIYKYLQETQDSMIPPSSVFSRLIYLLFEEESDELARMYHVLTEYYTESPYFLDWFDCLFAANKKTGFHLSRFLSDELAETFYQSINSLLNGTYAPSEIKHIFELQLPKYYQHCSEAAIKNSIAAMLQAWEQVFPGTINLSLIKNATFPSEKTDHIEQVSAFFLALKEWISSLELDGDSFNEWWLNYWLLDRNKKVMIAGNFNNGKSSFINSILGDEIVLPGGVPTTSVVNIIQYGPQQCLLELNETSIKEVAIENLQSKTTINHADDSSLSGNLIALQVQANSLKTNMVTLVDTPGFNDQNNENPTYQYLHLADELLLVLSSETPFTKKEKGYLEKIVSTQHDLPIRFVLNKADYMDEDEREEIIEDLERKLAKHFHENVVIYPYSSLYPDMEEQQNLRNYFSQQEPSIFEKRIKEAIPYFYGLLKNIPVLIKAKEHKINNTVLLRKKEIEDLKELKRKVDRYKNAVISQAVHNYIKDVITETYEESKPYTLNGLKQFSAKLDPNTLENAHLYLDREINDWLEFNLRQTIIPLIYHRFENWLQKQKFTLNLINADLRQFHLDVEDILNSTQEKRTPIPKDIIIDNFKNHFRTSANISYQQIDILKKFNPFQTILKGVGRLLGGKSHSATLKIEQYRNFLETKAYDEAASQYLYNITKTLGSFESLLRNELNEVFQDLEKYIDDEIDFSTGEMMKHAQQLKDFKDQKETYIENAKTFEVKIRQMEIDYSSLNKPLKVI